MDMNMFWEEAINNLWWLIPACLVLSLFKSSWFKRLFLTRLMTGVKLPKDKYAALHDVRLDIDGNEIFFKHIYLSTYGIFAIQTREMKGWIFGGKNRAEWTQKLYTKSNEFKNPLTQCLEESKRLADWLMISPKFIKPIVQFSGDCVFKTDMPDNVVKGLKSFDYIKTFTKEDLPAKKLEEIQEKISTAQISLR